MPAWRAPRRRNLGIGAVVAVVIIVGVVIAVSGSGSGSSSTRLITAVARRGNVAQTVDGAFTL